MFGTRAMDIIERINNNQIEFKCQSTGRPVEFVIVKGNIERDPFICTKCALEVLHTKKYEKEDIIEFDLFLKHLQKGIVQVRNNKINDEHLKECMDTIERKMVDKYGVCVTQSLNKLHSETIEKIEDAEVWTGESKDRVIRYENIDSIDQNQPDFTFLIQFYRNTHKNKQRILSSYLEKMKKEEMELKQKEKDNLTNLIKQDFNKVLAPIFGMLKMYPELSESTETINRFYTFSDSNQDFSCTMVHSVNIMVDQETWWYGFTQLAINQGSQNEATFAISEGKMKSENPKDTILLQKSLLESNMSKLVRINKKQSSNTFPIIFNSPLLLAPNVWYNLSLFFEDNSSNIFRSMKGQSISNQMQSISYTSKDGTTVTFSRGKNDTSKMSVFNGILPDFFISRYNRTSE